jgi:hypothetical protein
VADRLFEGEEAVLHVIERIVAPLGLRVDATSPWVDARLPDGSRVQTRLLSALFRRLGLVLAVELRPKSAYLAAPVAHRRTSSAFVRYGSTVHETSDLPPAAELPDLSGLPETLDELVSA